MKFVYLNLAKKVEFLEVVVYLVRIMEYSYGKRLCLYCAIKPSRVPGTEHVINKYLWKERGKGRRKGRRRKGWEKGRKEERSGENR